VERSELALARDIRIASSNAQFGQSEVYVGSIPAAGGTQRLPRMIGVPDAMLMMLTGTLGVRRKKSVQLNVQQSVQHKNGWVDLCYCFSYKKLIEKFEGERFTRFIRPIRATPADARRPPRARSRSHEEELFAFRRRSLAFAGFSVLRFV
jgi:hypothetical protein